MNNFSTVANSNGEFLAAGASVATALTLEWRRLCVALAGMYCRQQQILEDMQFMHESKDKSFSCRQSDLTDRTRSGALQLQSLHVDSSPKSEQVGD